MRHALQLASARARRRLSRRSCVQIVMKLQEMGLVDLLFTRDGKEYITPKQLEREVRDEIFVHGGRVSFSDLEDILNVDVAHIERTVAALEKAENSLFVVNREIITKSVCTLVLHPRCLWSARISFP